MSNVAYDLAQEIIIRRDDADVKFDRESVVNEMVATGSVNQQEALVAIEQVLDDLSDAYSMVAKINDGELDDPYDLYSEFE